MISQNVFGIALNELEVEEFLWRFSVIEDY